MAEIGIFPFSQQDIKAVAQIEKQCFCVAWTVAQLEAELKNKTAHFYTAKISGEIVGYAGMYLVYDECYMANIAVLPAFRRCGIADSLLTQLEQTAKDNKASFLSLEVRASNQPAIALYKKHGFVRVGIRKNYYTQPQEDAILMTEFFEENEYENTCD